MALVPLLSITDRLSPLTKKADRLLALSKVDRQQMLKDPRVLLTDQTHTKTARMHPCKCAWLCIKSNSGCFALHLEFVMSRLIVSAQSQPVGSPLVSPPLRGCPLPRGLPPTLLTT